MSDSLLAGVATANVTPPAGTWLCGFGGRPTGAVGVHDELLAKALVLDDGDTSLALVTSDIIGFTGEMVRDIRQMAHGQTGIPPENIMLSASHTHSGPVTAELHAMGKPDEAYLAVLRRKVAGIIRQAFESRRPAGIGFGAGDVQIGINRRHRTDQGTVLGRNDGGVVDPHVYVLRVDSEAHQPGVVVFNHAAHPVTLGGSNLLVSADYPGVAQRVIEQIEPGATAMFAQGCCGNINSEPVGGSFEDARRLGTILGAATVAAAERVQASGEARLRAAVRPIDLPTQDPPPAEEMEAQAASHRANLEKAKAEGAPEGTILLHQGLLAWTEWVAGLAREGRTGMTVLFEVQAFAFDGTAIVALSGEVFIEIAQAIQAGSPFERTLVFGYTNGCVGYIWPREVAAEGGYEPDHSIIYYGTLRLDPGAGERVVEAAVDMLASL